MSINNLNGETKDASPSLLELAANNDIEGFRRSVHLEPSGIDRVGLWYGRQKGSKQMVLLHRTPLMVAATYGSLDVMKLIISFHEVDINRSCGLDKSTALHCAASGGSSNALDIVNLLLEAGADPNLTDANGDCPLDVILVPPSFQELKFSLQMVLNTNASFGDGKQTVSRVNTNSISPPSSPAPGNTSHLSASESEASPRNTKLSDSPMLLISEKKEYPIDPSLPDIKNSIYSTDEFRMFSFKVRPCSRAYSHDWTECPFVHPGENARRRDPRKYHYSCVPCPDFRKGACRRGDMCEYAHGVFECWLHPAQYRTRLCKDGTTCSRRVCFFAHTQEELRPLYVSTGSAVPSPRASSSATNGMDFAVAANLLPLSPSSVSVMPPSPFTPPLSPSANGISTMGWAQQNVPALHLPGSNLQASRLRSSLNARDIPYEEMNVMLDFDVQQKQLLNELSLLSQSNINTNSLSRSTRSKALNPSNLEDIFSVESSSPRYSDQTLASAVFSPTQKSAVLNQFQQHQPSMMSPINTNFSPKNVDHSLLQASFGVPSPGRMSPRGMEPMSPIGSWASIVAQREKRQQQFRSLSSRDLGVNAAVAVASSEDNWSNWGSTTGKPDWTVNSDEFGELKRSSSFEHLNNGEEPDVSWVQSLVKESSQETKEKYTSSPRTLGMHSGAASSGEDDTDLHPQIDQTDQSTLGAWLEQMQLDQLMAQ